LHAGRKIDPYFAHFANEGSLDCEDYHPGLWGSVSYTNNDALPEIEDSPAEAGLCLDDSENNWAIYLRLPEIPSHELSAQPLAALRQAQVEIKAVGIKIESLPAFDLFPGVGVARIKVPPTCSEYHVLPTGDWPPGINTQRWILLSNGINQNGTLFRFSRGEWVRLRLGSLVEWGEPLCVVADSHIVPPITCTPNAVKSHKQSNSNWKLWRIHLPYEQSLIIERWLESLGHPVSAPAAQLKILSIPDSLDPETKVPQFTSGTPLVAKVITSHIGDKSSLALCFESNKFTLPFCSGPESREAFFEVSVGRPGNYALEVNSERDSIAEFDYCEAKGIKNLREALVRLPRLRLLIGETVFQPWSEYPAIVTVNHRGAVPEVHVDLGEEGIRLDLFITANNVRQVRNQISPRDVERRIQEALSKRQATNLRLDAGALGSLTVDIRIRELTEPVEAVNRIAGWLACASAKQSTEPSFMGAAVTRYITQDSNLLITSLRSPHPALAAQLRAAAKRNARNKRRSKR
jgi:hypothetical protein